MKKQLKSLIYLSMLLIIFSGCSKDNDVIVNSPMSPPTWAQGFWKSSSDNGASTITITTNNVISMVNLGGGTLTFNFYEMLKDGSFTKISQVATDSFYSVEGEMPSSGGGRGYLFLEFNKEPDGCLNYDGVIYTKQ